LTISRSVLHLQIYFIVEFSPVNYPRRFPKYAVRIAEEINGKSGRICSESDSPAVLRKFTHSRCQKYLANACVNLSSQRVKRSVT